MSGDLRRALTLLAWSLCLAAAARAQTYDFEDGQPPDAGGGVRPRTILDLHPAVVLPGEVLTVRLRVFASVDDPRRRAAEGTDAVTAGNQRQSVQGLELRIVSTEGRTVLTSSHDLDGQTDKPDPCGELAEWSWTWDPDRVAPGPYLVEVAVRDAASEVMTARADLQLGGLPPLAPEAGAGAAADSLGQPRALHCRLEARPRRVHPGETVTIMLVVENPHPGPVCRTFPDQAVFGWSLYDGEDRLVAFSHRGEHEDTGRLAMAPGEVVRRQWTWTWDGSHPGRHYLQAGLGRLGDQDAAPWLELALWPPSPCAWDLDRVGR